MCPCLTGGQSTGSGRSPSQRGAPRAGRRSCAVSLSSRRRRRRACFDGCFAIIADPDFRTTVVDWRPLPPSCRQWRQRSREQARRSTRPGCAPTRPATCSAGTRDGTGKPDVPKHRWSLLQVLCKVKAGGVGYHKVGRSAPFSPPLLQLGSIDEVIAECLCAGLLSSTLRRGRGNTPLRL